MLTTLKNLQRLMIFLFIMSLTHVTKAAHEALIEEAKRLIFHDSHIMSLLLGGMMLPGGDGEGEGSDSAAIATSAYLQEDITFSPPHQKSESSSSTNGFSETYVQTSFHVQGKNGVRGTVNLSASGETIADRIDVLNVRIGGKLAHVEL